MVKLSDLNEHITCYLCKGYLVNATAISECMHTFCKGCIVKEFIKNSACPECGISVNPTEPTKTLKSDNQLQDLINKIVPGFAKAEQAARKQFYISRGEPEEESVEPIDSTFLTAKKRTLYRQAGLPVYVMLQHERNNAASSIRIKRYPGHMIRFPSELTVLHLKDFIRQRLSLGVQIPSFEDVKSQRVWERSRLLAIQNAPDVDILFGDYLLDEDVTLGLLSRIKFGLVKQPVLPLTYRFRGTLKCPAQLIPSANDASLSLTVSSTRHSHVTCLSRGKGKATTRSVRGKSTRPAAVLSRGSAPLAPRRVLVNNKSPVVRKAIVLNKSAPLVKKSIVIQRSSKPPGGGGTNAQKAQPQRVILKNANLKPFSAGKKTIVIQKTPNPRGPDGPKGSVVKLQRAVRPR